MDLDADQMQQALGKVAAAWRGLNPDRDENEMPEPLKAASEPVVMADPDERPGRDYLAAMKAKLKELLGVSISEEDWNAAHKHAMSSAGGKGKAKKRKQDAEAYRDHAIQHPELVQGCEYCGDPYIDVLKMPKADARASYRMAGSDPMGERCGMCRFYQFGSCSLVEGAIEYDYLCDLYLAAPKIGPSMTYNISELCAADKPIRLFIELPKVS